jgi:hypothetical protein
MLVTLADIVSPVIKEAIDKYDFSLIDACSYNATYSNGEYIIFIDLEAGIYRVEVNMKTHNNVPLDLINHLIVTEIEMP